MRNLLALLITAISCSVTCANDTIEVAFFVRDGDKRGALLKEEEKFKLAHPDVNIAFLMVRDNFSKKVNDWLRAGEGPEIIAWNGGAQIRYFSEKGLLQKLNYIKNKINLEENFSPAAIHAVSSGDDLLGIPITLHFWGFYFRPSNFKYWDIEFPKTWPETLNLCQELRKKNIDLFSFSAKPKWITHAWFDYLVLRVQGIEFYRDLTKGVISYKDKRVKEVLEHWLQLIDNGCFYSKYKNLTFETSFPRVYRQLSASVLSYKRIKLPDSIKDDLAIAPFPSIKPDIPQYSVSPVDSFIVGSYATKSKALETVLSYLANPEFQTTYNHSEDRIPAHKKSKLIGDELTTSEANLIHSAPDAIQFFDRETPLKFAEKTPEIFMNFVSHKNIERCTSDLEELRVQIYSAKQ